MEKVFSAEDLRIRTSMSSLQGAADSSPQMEQLSRRLVENLLCPLSSSMYDVEHLNRRQAAALLAYLVDPSVEVQRVVRAWVKMLKDSNLGKYLEAILVALKKSYEEKIRSVIAQHREAVEQFGSAANPDEDEDYPGVLQEEGAVLLHFAQRLAQTLGVGRAKGSTRELLVVFFRVGISYALQEVDNGGFLALLEPFLKLLGVTEAGQVLGVLEEACDQCSEEVRRVVVDGLEAGEGGVDSHCAGAFEDFSTRLTAAAGKEKGDTALGLLWGGESVCVDM